jgi:Holliday junction DNA helicase RuvA
VSGIGPKVALAVLSGIEPAELLRAIRSSDVGRLTRIPGVGKKTAERIVLELKDRLPQADVAGPAAPSGDVDDVRADLLSALGNLGYQRAAAEKAVDKVLRDADGREFEPLLRATLKLLMGR